MNFDYDTPYNEYFKFPEEVLLYEVPVLFYFLKEHDSHHLTARILNSLNRARVTTIGELLTKTRTDLMILRGLGHESQKVLNDVLKRASTDIPSLQYYHILNKVDPLSPSGKRKPDRIKKIKDRYLKKVIQNHTQSTSL